MLLNRFAESLVKSPPSIGSNWIEKLEDWLRIIAGRSFEAVFRLQHEMLEAVVNVEKEIQEGELRRKELGSAIPVLKARGDVAQIRSHQVIITALNRRGVELRYVRDCILLVGDTIASLLLEVDAIKHMALYQSPGFISGKEGLDSEIEAANTFYRQGWMVLFNDLTHSVRIGDLTLKKGEITKTFEVKSSAAGYLSKDALRQIMTPIMIHDYIKNDQTRVPVTINEDTDIAPAGTMAAGARRLESNIKENWQFDVPGNLYRLLKRHGFALLKRGAVYYVAARKERKPELLERLRELTADGDWIGGNLQQRVVDYADIPPFSRWFRPNSTVEIMVGDVSVISVINLHQLAILFDAKDIEISWKRQNDDLLPIRFTPRFELNPEVEVQQINLCNWQRLRMLYAFLSDQTFVDICAFMLSVAARKPIGDKPVIPTG